MTEKKAPLGICDLCGGPIDEPWTSKRRPRLYCSLTCKNTGNSRAGAPERSRKAKLRVASGQWQNPMQLRPPTSSEQAERARIGRRREVEAGVWRNPALTLEARAKLSQPRKHSGELASAIEKLRRGVKLAELSEEERLSHREYRRQLYQARLDSVRSKYRQWYAKRSLRLSPAERERQREKWRTINRRRAERKAGQSPHFSGAQRIPRK